MDEQELPVEAGVTAGDSFESAQPVTAPETPRQPERVNLDELPEFRKYRSETDRRMAQMEQRYQQQLAYQAQQLKQRDVAELDDYGRVEYELNETRQREQYATQRLQELEANQQKMDILREISLDMDVPIEALVEAQDPREAYRLARAEQRRIEQQRETERKSAENRRVAERAEKIANNRVDVGSGSPVTADTEWEKQYLTAKARKDARSLFNLALRQ